MNCEDDVGRRWGAATYAIAFAKASLAITEKDFDITVKPVK